MNSAFHALIEGRDSKFATVLAMKHVTVDAALDDTPKSGIYLLFSGRESPEAGSQCQTLTY